MTIDIRLICYLNHKIRETLWTRLICGSLGTIEKHHIQWHWILQSKQIYGYVKMIDLHRLDWGEFIYLFFFFFDYIIFIIDSVHKFSKKNNAHHVITNTRTHIYSYTHWHHVIHFSYIAFHICTCAHIIFSHRSSQGLDQNQFTRKNVFTGMDQNKYIIIDLIIRVMIEIERNDHPSCKFYRHPMALYIHWIKLTFCVRCENLFYLFYRFRFHLNNINNPLNFSFAFCI